MLMSMELFNLLNNSLSSLIFGTLVTFMLVSAEHFRRALFMRKKGRVCIARYRTGPLSYLPFAGLLSMLFAYVAVDTSALFGNLAVDLISDTVTNTALSRSILMLLELSSTI